MTEYSTAVGDIGPVRAPRATSRHAPPGIYSDPAIYQMEKNKIFMRNWMMVAREEELAKPGDFIATRIFEEPVLLTRDTEGKLHAFANVCQHRGVEVAFGSGNTKQFMCPYHGWTYRLDGKLLGAPLSSDNSTFDRRSCKLPDIALGLWGGNVYINFADNPQPFEEFIAPYQAQFGYLHQERCRMGSKQSVELNCNWKFAVENLIDIYHVQILHICTFCKTFAAGEVSVKLGELGRVTYEYKAAPQTPEGKTLVGRMPWLGDEKGNDLGHTYRMPPNMHMFARIDMVEQVLIWPVAVDKCRLVVYDLFPEEFVNAPDFGAKAKIYADYILQILEEDRSMADSLQRAMSSKNFRAGPIVGMEVGIHHVINDYLERMGFANGASRGG
jgi:choline monooxygenase